jgi:hypothetical protein
MTLEQFFNFFTVAHTMQMLLALLIFIIIITMVQMTRNPSESFDLKDLVSTDGRLNERKFTRFGAWVISTWGFVYILINNPGNFPEWYFVGYMAVWVGNAIMDKYMTKKQDHSQ